MLNDHSAEIAAAYGLGTPRSEPVLSARGEQGQVWRLDTERGSYAVKELILRQQETEAAEDVAYQEAALAAVAVHLPRPIRTTQDRVLTEVGAHQVRVYEWVDLLPADRGQDPGLIGSAYAAIHRLQHHTVRPLVGWYTDPVGPDRWTALLAESEAVAAPFAAELAAEIPYLVELEGLIEVPTNLQMCHRDLWSDNMLPLADGDVCIIDWENCGLADPAHELPMALLDFCLGDQGRAAALYAAYRESGGPARLRHRGDFTMVIAQFGHFWEMAIESYLAADATADDKSHSIERIGELTSMPLRLEHIDSMLDWTAGIH